MIACFKTLQVCQEVHQNDRHVCLCYKFQNLIGMLGRWSYDSFKEMELQFQNLIGMLGSPFNRGLFFLRNLFQNLIGMLGRETPEKVFFLYTYSFKTLQVCQEVWVRLFLQIVGTSFQNLIGMLGSILKKRSTTQA